MKCVIVGANIKIFSKAIHSLAKIGSALFIEPNENALSLRSINDNKSAFVSFTFNKDFFSEYCVQTNESDELSNYDGKCKINIVACLGIFRNMKKVEFCKIAMDMEKLLVEMHCHLKTKKNYIISVIDVETLQTAYTFDDNVSRVSASHKVFGDISNNFQMSEEEITLDFDLHSVIVKNYVQGSPVDPKFMRSQLTLKPDEFTTYSVKEKVSITFCLREFRALLNFVELFNLDLILKFSQAGKPALFTSEILDEFEASLLLSTLAPIDSEFLKNSIRENTVSRNQTQFESSVSTKSNNMRITNEKLKDRRPVESEQIFFGTIQESNENTDIIMTSLSKENRKNRIRTVFTRCFPNSRNTNLNDVCNSTVLAQSSDTEE